MRVNICWPCFQAEFSASEYYPGDVIHIVEPASCPFCPTDEDIQANKADRILAERKENF